MKPSNVSKYPSRKPDLICILTPHRPAVFPNAHHSGDQQSMLDGLQTFFTLMSDKNVEVTSIKDHGMEIEFDITGVDPCIVNAIRRSLLSEVPSMAPETVLMIQNTSVFPDDTIGSRLGLIPFRADPRRFKFRPIDSRAEHPDYTVMFDLIVPPVRMESAAKGGSKLAKTSSQLVKVYSKNLKFIPHPQYPISVPESDLRPVDEDILLVSLLPSQELQLRTHVVKGIGKDHAKFSPVATATYRPRPEIQLLTTLFDENAKKLQCCFSAGVIGIEQKGNRSVAFVQNSRLYTGGRKIFEDDILQSAVQIGFRQNEFIFTVESIGALKASVLVQQAIEILKKRCEYHSIILDMFSNQKWFSPIKVEDDV